MPSTPWEGGGGPRRRQPTSDREIGTPPQSAIQHGHARHVGAATSESLEPKRTPYDVPETRGRLAQTRDDGVREFAACGSVTVTLARPWKAMVPKCALARTSPRSLEYGNGR